mmetsp:Transcript_8656/g.13737  ORF Transcript_8656/g.13737 Transcript_8656/m.13737 type:complete len:511 (+) Transcript_8656:157-1689(+)|eukprot:CAMPEP_0115076722 /NCGR_PEP_ID=MMETSP0227-20121206/16592_1 /TAXON_ID=89957 /ORGANISM="Polarella glacialis, Strain CCMP 1383" /LENGTH=510 /DNA_ID=CAMNT_0002463909 /DNA_START=96 /DNA_END=1628 /DNA_ORIENTATION=-
MSQQAAPLLPHEMEHIRKVFDEDVGSKKFNSIISPREDAQMFRNTDKHASPCECIIELYELLWRWGHRNTASRGFAQNFGFAIPDTIVIVKGRPYAWYFISKKDGTLLRKSEGNLSLSALEKKICTQPPPGDDPDGPKKASSAVPVAVWLPMASQFPEARCHSPNADFLSASGLRKFIQGMRNTHSGIIQTFVEPHGVSNFLVRTVEFRRQTSLCVRTNRSVLNSGRGTLFDRAATFEGWDGLSSSSSRYRSHRHPHMEDLILAAGETLNRRIEQERVRQMLFLGPHQHVALHFKVTSDNMLYFIFASIISEKDVILQTRPQLLMGDPCMTEELPGAALLPGGTGRKAMPYEAAACYSARGARELAHEDDPEKAHRESSLPPIRGDASPRGRPTSGREGKALQRRPLSERRHLNKETLLPRMEMGHPQIPAVPYKTLSLAHSLEDPGGYEYLPYAGLSGFKRPLIMPITVPSEPSPDSRFGVEATLAARDSAGAMTREESPKQPDDNPDR